MALAQEINPSTESDTAKDTPGSEEVQDTGMDYKGDMPMPKRRKRNNGKRDDY